MKAFGMTGKILCFKNKIIKKKAIKEAVEFLRKLDITYVKSFTDNNRNDLTDSITKFFIKDGVIRYTEKILEKRSIFFNKGDVVVKIIEIETRFIIGKDDKNNKFFCNVIKFYDYDKQLDECLKGNLKPFENDKLYKTDTMYLRDKKSVTANESVMKIRNLPFYRKEAFAKNRWESLIVNDWKDKTLGHTSITRPKNKELGLNYDTVKEYYVF